MTLYFVLKMEGHLAPDHDPFRYRSGNARIVVSNSCSAFRERKHFIGTSDRDYHLRQLSRGSYVFSKNRRRSQVGGHR